MKKLLYGFGIISALLGIFLFFGGAGLFTPSLPQTSQANQPAEFNPNTQTSLLIQPNSGVAPLLALLNQTISSIDLTIYTISDSRIIAALIAAEKRGVAVRVLYNDKFFLGSGQKTNQQTMDLLTPGGIQVKKASSDFVLTHQKSFILDDNKAIIMSFNLEPSYFSTSRDFAMITTDPGEVSEIEAVFEADWNEQKINPSAPALVWSPDNSRVKLKKLINGANKTLDIYAMELHDSEMMGALIAAEKRGVSVQVITAKLWDGKSDGNADWHQALAEVGVEVKIGSLFTHAKMILADFGTSAQIAYVGSINFSENSLDKNRELGILSSDKTALDALLQVFEEDWRLAE